MASSELIDKIFRNVEGIIDFSGDNAWIRYILIIFTITFLFLLAKFKLAYQTRDITEFAFHLFIVTLLGIMMTYINILNVNITLTDTISVGLIILLIVTSIYVRQSVLFTKGIRQVTRNYLNALYSLGLVALFISTAINTNIVWILLLILILFFLHIYGRKGGLENNEGEENIEKSVLGEEHQNTSESSDLPINSFDKLFETRKKECYRIYEYIKQLDTDEPFAIAINAEWGQGKTSFINGLQEKIKSKEGRSANIIFIQPMILDNRKKLLKYVFGQLETILINNGIYTGKGSPYKKYFDLLLKFAGEKHFTGFTELFDPFRNDEKTDLREYKINLENNIVELLKDKQRIYIIIDDLDRVEKETVREMLTFIKEIVDLKGVLILFLLDYKKVITEEITIDYLEKFINEKFDLVKISRNEILEYYIERLILDDKLEKVKEEVKELRENYQSYLQEIDESLQAQMNRLDNLIEEKEAEGNVEEQQTFQDKKQKLISSNEFYNNKLSNARYLKKIVLDVMESLYYYQKIISSKNEFQKVEQKNVDASHLILKLSIFKTLFKEQYEEILEIGDIDKFLSGLEYQNFTKVFFKETDKDLILFENDQILYELKMKFYNSFIFSKELSKGTFLEIKGENDKIIEDIDAESVINEETFNFEKLTDYLNAINYMSGVSEDSNELRIEKFTELTISLVNSEKISLMNVFELLGDPGRNILVEYPGFYKKVIELLGKSGIRFVKDQYKTASISNLKMLDSSLVFKNGIPLQIVIYIYYLDNNHYSLESIRESFSNTHSLEDLNKSLIDILNVNIDKTKTTIDQFRAIVNTIKYGVEEKHGTDELIMRSTKFYFDKLQKFIVIMQLKEELIGKIKVVPIKNNNEFEVIKMQLTKAEMNDHINRLYNFLNSNSTRIKYNLFAYFRSLLNSINDFVNKGGSLENEFYLKLEEAFNKFDDVHKKDRKLFDEGGWHYCLIIFAKIRKAKLGE